MGSTARGAEHPLDPKDRPREGGLSTVATVLNEQAFTVANTCPVSCGLQVYACQFTGIVNLCNWYIDKGRSKV